VLDSEYKGRGIMASYWRTDKMRKGDCVAACAFVRVVVWGFVMVLVLWLLAGCAGQQGGGKKEEQASEGRQGGGKKRGAGIQGAAERSG
jgi:hypothetical protein